MGRLEWSDAREQRAGGFSDGSLAPVGVNGAQGMSEHPEPGAQGHTEGGGGRSKGSRRLAEGLGFALQVLVNLWRRFGCGLFSELHIIHWAPKKTF